LDRLKNIAVTIACDFIVLILSWYVYYYLRFRLIWEGSNNGILPATLFIPALIIAIYWIVIFAIFGLYKGLYLISRFDETIQVIKITVIGTLILFFLLFIDTLGWNIQNIKYAKTYTLIYWLVVVMFVSFNRFIIRSIQRYRVQKGKGLHKAIIVGTGESALSIYDNLKRHPTSGMQVVGFVGTGNDIPKSVRINDETKPCLGAISSIKALILAHNIQHIIVALEKEDNDQIINIINEIDIPDISVKILPDFYQMIIGLNQTNQIFGLPLIEVMPDPMPSWEKFTKRVFDILLSSLILVVTLPLSVIIGILVRITSKGPAIYRQKRVGLYGKEFTMFKFRTMFIDAEKGTGPVWASKEDPRITPLGYWLRKLRLDELPQFINVIKGDMSLVGPRPERPYFVEKFKSEIPLYSRRLRVRPGITGWAQVKWKYDTNIEDVREKTKYDLFYVENISLRMDFKILLNTILTVMAGKGQ